MTRPEVRLCMATSLDGRIAEKAGQGPSFTSRYDLNKLFRLRAEADMLLVGAGTVRTESLPPLVRSEEARKAREAKGLSPHPAVAVLSGSLNLPWDAAYFTKAQQPITIIGGPATTEQQAKMEEHKLGYINAGRPVNLAQAMDELGKRGVTSVLAEGGGRVVNALLQEDLIDVFYLTIAPTFIGGEDTPLLNLGASITPRKDLKLEDVHREDEELHLTYRRVS